MCRSWSAGTAAPQAFTTKASRADPVLEGLGRAHARVEDRIRTGKDTGLGNLLSRQEQMDAGRVELALIAADLLVLARSMLRTTKALSNQR